MAARIRRSRHVLRDGGCTARALRQSRWPVHQLARARRVDTSPPSCDDAVPSSCCGDEWVGDAAAYSKRDRPRRHDGCPPRQYQRPSRASFRVLRQLRRRRHQPGRLRQRHDLVGRAGAAKAHVRRAFHRSDDRCYPAPSSLPASRRSRSVARIRNGERIPPCSGSVADTGTAARAVADADSEPISVPVAINAARVSTSVTCRAWRVDRTGGAFRRVRGWSPMEAAPLGPRMLGMNPARSPLKSTLHVRALPCPELGRTTYQQWRDSATGSAFHRVPVRSR